MKSANAAPINYYHYVEDILAPEDIHDTTRVNAATSGTGLFIIIALVLVVLHGLNLYLFLAGGLGVLLPLLIHLAVSAVTLAIAYSMYRSGMDVHHLALLAIVSSLTGIFGAAGALVGYISTLLLSARAHRFNDWYETIFPTDTQSEPQNIYDSIIEGIDENPSRYSVMPFLDVMRLGSENQKRRALAKMTSRFNPRFSSAFKSALSDKNNTIRVQAATAIAKVEKDFAHKLERIEMARAMEPKNPMLTLALAKFYDDYAFTGVLDAELEKLNRERAINTYKSYLQQDPNAAEAWVAIGRLLFRNRQWQEAAEWFRHALDRGWKTNGMILWYFECLFRLGDHVQLRRAVLEYGRGIIGQEELPSDVREAVSLWMQVA